MQGEELDLPTAHDIARNPGCPVCHLPHGGERRALLRAEENLLCRTCHERTIGEEIGLERPEASAGAPRIALYAGSIGHPVGRHPVAGFADPSTPGRTLLCGSCHRPHGSDSRSLLLLSPGMGSCVRCHRD